MASRTVIVGGVAAGASAAARLRRLDENREIILLERGAYVSFANCGLPYFLGGEIADRKKLLVQTPERLHALLNIDVRVLNQVVLIDRENKKIQVRDLEQDKEYWLSYDQLVLATGSQALMPPIPGMGGTGQFHLRTIPDMDQIHEWVAAKKARRAVVIGGGYIGIEAAEQLKRRGLEVTVVQSTAHILAPFDSDMVGLLESELVSQGINLVLDNPASAFKEMPGEKFEIQVTLKDGSTIAGDLVILAIGVRPEAQLAQSAGLELGKYGGIRVNEHLQSSDPAIFAVGDSIEVRDLVTGEWIYLPLAGPANRQGRIVADNIAGRPSEYAGSLGTAILRVFDLVAACTGANEAKLKHSEIDYQVIYLHPNSHAGYYPGAKKIAIKMLFSPVTRKLLGVQCIGEDGVDKRIDVFATALKAGMTVDQLADLELAYAPPFGSAKDPVNLAGMAAQNVLNHDISLAYWHEVAALDVKKTILLDVRDQAERDAGTIPGSLHIPVTELRSRLSELRKDREIVCFCASGQRSALATRLLMQHGFKARNLTGAYLTWKSANAHLL